MHRRWQPILKSYRFHGIKSTRHPEITAACSKRAGIIFCPSNPFVSIEPILNVKGMRDLLQKTRVPKLPCRRSWAVKHQRPGRENVSGLGWKHPPSRSQTAAGWWTVLCWTGWMKRRRRSIKDLGMRVWVTDTVMRNELERERLGAGNCGLGGQVMDALMAIVPVKPPAEAKTRLAGVLDESGPRRVGAAILERTLLKLTRARGIPRVVVIRVMRWF